ncbi:MAG: RNA polymerase subunit sigma [Myxococcales bacterium]|nr:RNA polymerase subunit sigma [Myxococcales bacterium]
MRIEARDKATFHYISLANRAPRLARELELELARAYIERGDLEAKHRILCANLRHVTPVALRHRGYGIALGELVAQGSLALVAALDRFDPSRGLRFSTYAKHWIRAEILLTVLQHRSLVGGGKGPLRGKYFFRLRRELAELMAKLGDRERVVGILSERHRKSPQQLESILARIDERDASFDADQGDSSGSSLHERIASNNQVPEELVARSRLLNRLGPAVRDATADLSERERFIVEHRLLADRNRRLPLLEVGRHFGVSGERARQIESGVKNKLRKRLSSFADEVPAISA